MRLAYVKDLQVLQTEDFEAEVLADQREEGLLESEAVDAEQQTVFERFDAFCALYVGQDLLALLEDHLLELLALFVQRFALDELGEVVVVLVLDAQQAGDLSVLLSVTRAYRKT